VNQQIAVIRQHPFGLSVAFHTVGQLTGVLLELYPNFVRDGLNLPLIGSRADDEIVRERSDSGEVQYPDIGGFLGFCGADSEEPGWRCDFGVGCFRKIGLGQNTLLCVSYYSGEDPAEQYG
jgi:hypothetical protein